MKKFLPLIFMLALLLTGCSGEDDTVQQPAAMEVSKAGMTMTLTEEFSETEYVGYTAMYNDADVLILALKEEFTLFENTDYSGESSVEEYAGLVWSANGLATALELQSADGLTWFEYQNDVNGVTYQYRAYAFKAADAFWLVQFGTFADKFAALEDTVHGYAKTIVFDGPAVG